LRFFWLDLSTQRGAERYLTILQSPIFSGPAVVNQPGEGDGNIG
jgi:hypothetical protein